MATCVGGLTWLLDPISVEAFLSSYYEQDILYVAPADDDRLAGLPTIDDVESLLASRVFPQGDPLGGERLVRAEADGTLAQQRVPRLPESGTVDFQSVYRAYHDGFTLVINQVHRRWPRIGSLCRAVQAQLHHPVAANLYLTPASSQGFLPHVDSHDVFVLQLHGAKSWQISRPTRQLPLALHSRERHQLPDAQTFTLHPGDVLYLPRGFRHAAGTGGSSSIHLTIGVDAIRWRDIVVGVLDVVADQDRTFREAVDLYFDETLPIDQVRSRASRLAAAFADPTILETVRQQLRSRLVTTTAQDGKPRFASVDRVCGLTPESLLSRDPSGVCLVHTGGGEARIEFPGNHVSGPSRIGPALQYIATTHRFAVADLPGAISVQDQLDLVTRLVTEGLLEVEEP